MPSSWNDVAPNSARPAADKQLSGGEPLLARFRGRIRYAVSGGLPLAAGDRTEKAIAVDDSTRSRAGDQCGLAACRRACLLGTRIVIRTCCVVQAAGPT